jgi:hypothetical protein
MSNQRYPEEFKIQAVNQVTEKQLPVSLARVLWVEKRQPITRLLKGDLFPAHSVFARFGYRNTATGLDLA